MAVLWEVRRAKEGSPWYCDEAGQTIAAVSDATGRPSEEGWEWLMRPCEAETVDEYTLSRPVCRWAFAQLLLGLRLWPRYL